MRRVSFRVWCLGNRLAEVWTYLFPAETILQPEDDQFLRWDNAADQLVPVCTRVVKGSDDIRFRGLGAAQTHGGGRAGGGGGGGTGQGGGGGVGGGGGGKGGQLTFRRTPFCTLQDSHPTGKLWQRWRAPRKRS